MRDSNRMLQATTSPIYTHTHATTLIPPRPSIGRVSLAARVITYPFLPPRDTTIAPAGAHSPPGHSGGWHSVPPSRGNPGEPDALGGGKGGRSKYRDLQARVCA